MQRQSAWLYTFEVRRVVSNLGEEPVPNEHMGLQGVIRTDRFEFVASGQEPVDGVVGQLSVISDEPYAADALPDAVRRAHDACNALSLAYTPGEIFSVIEESANEKRLDGAKDPEPAGMRLDMRFETVIATRVEARAWALEAAEHVAQDLELRADLDTWRLAQLEEDGPTRMIHHYRIYERLRASRKREPRLLTPEHIRAVRKALSGALPPLCPKDRERVLGAVSDLLVNTPKRPGHIVLAERLSRSLGRTVTPAQAKAMDEARGSYAHGSAPKGSQPESQTSELLRDAAVSFLRASLRALGRQEP